MKRMNIEQQLTYLTYDEISLRIDSQIETIKRERFVAIAVIVRGGLFPAQHLSVRTGLPIYYLRSDRSHSPAKTSWIGESAPHGKLLLVEDMAGSGKTLTGCQSFLLHEGYQVHTFVLFQDTLSASKPDYVCFLSDKRSHTFILPWEKAKYNPAYYKREKGVPFVDQHFEFTAWDFRCIHSYRTMIEASGSVEESDYPSIRDSDVFLLTDYVTSNDEELFQWLKAIGVTSRTCQREILSEQMNDYAIALWKKQKIQELGCSRYVENSAEQALVLSQFLPFIEILWWNDGSPVSIKSSSFTF